MTTSDITVLCCPTCLQPLSMTTRRRPHCLACGSPSTDSAIPGRPANAPAPETPRQAPPRSSGTKEAAMVLCCAECENTLSTLPGGGSYCVNCKYTPSMQDTFFKRVCPADGTEVKRVDGARTCPKCGDTFTG